MKNELSPAQMELKDGLPAYCIWRIMRFRTSRSISQEAVIEMQRHITNVIREATAQADNIQTEFNGKLPERLRRDRLTAESVLEALNNGKE